MTISVVHSYVYIYIYIVHNYSYYSCRVKCCVKYRLSKCPMIIPFQPYVRTYSDKASEQIASKWSIAMLLKCDQMQFLYHLISIKQSSIAQAYAYTHKTVPGLTPFKGLSIFTLNMMNGIYSAGVIVIVACMCCIHIHNTQIIIDDW